MNKKHIFLILLLAFSIYTPSLCYGQFPVDHKVKVKWADNWHACTVLKVEPGRYYVHFEDDERIFDRWVPENLVENFTYMVGDILLVEKDGKWVSGRVFAAGTTKYKIHFLQLESSNDEWVGPARIREVTYKTGDKVMVTWEGEWFEARILKYDNGRYFVNFIGFPDTNNQWVDVSRMKKIGQ